MWMKSPNQPNFKSKIAAYSQVGSVDLSFGSDREMRLHFRTENFKQLNILDRIRYQIGPFLF